MILVVEYFNMLYSNSQKVNYEMSGNPIRTTKIFLFPHITFHWPKQLISIVERCFDTTIF